MRGVTDDHDHDGRYYTISTRTPHAGSDFDVDDVVGVVSISTRTPHAGSDAGSSRQASEACRISTRTPHAGSDTAQRRIPT